ncbi:MAG: hypothetical protein EBW42_02660 [Rhodobacterales bacterium]|nr:hypothetical protein [Rhodobacterales bacterium]NCX70095.1 hypothetical protein [Paracoccaceae bacterium]
MEGDIVKLIDEFGLPVIMSIGMGYFIWYIWKFVQDKLLPEIEVMHMALIRVIDQTRMLDQDLIRLQQKVDTVLEYKENEQRRKAKQSSK